MERFLLAFSILAYGCNKDDDEKDDEKEADPLSRPSAPEGSLTSTLAQTIANPQESYDDLWSGFGPGATQATAPLLILERMGGSAQFPNIGMCRSYDVVWGAEGDLDLDQIQDDLALNYTCTGDGEIQITGIILSEDFDTTSPHGGFSFEVNDLTRIPQQGSTISTFTTYDANLLSVRNDDGSVTATVDYVEDLVMVDAGGDERLAIFLDSQINPDEAKDGTPRPQGAVSSFSGWFAYSSETEEVVLSVEGTDLVYASSCPSGSGNRFESGTLRLVDADATELVLAYKDCKLTATYAGQQILP